MQRANVVENVGIAMCHAQEENEEIEPPQHLEDACEGVVIRDVEEGEIAKASHPNVACNKDANAIVYLHGMHVMIQ